MLVSFVAPKQFGKSTACSILKKHWGDDVAQINFKDGLIAEIKQNFPDLLREISSKHYAFKKDEVLTGGDAIDSLFVSKPPLIRTLMQNYGTEVRRKENPRHWTDKYQDMVGKSQATHIMTDDCRFINEAETIKNYGGILIRLNRTDKVNTDTHQSETEQFEIKCDYEITCAEGEFDKLERELLAIVATLV